jgi:hypothetical protein
MQYLHEIIGGVLADNLGPQQDANGSELPVEVVAEFYAAAAIGLLRWWIDNDFRHGPTWLATTYRQIAARGAPTTAQ